MRDEKWQRQHTGRVLRRAGQSRRQTGERVVAPPTAIGDRREPPQRPGAKQEQQAFTSRKMRHVHEAHGHRRKPRRDETCRLIDGLSRDPKDQEHRGELTGERGETRQPEREEQDRSIGVIRVGQLGVARQLIPERLTRRECVRDPNRHIGCISVQARVDEVRGRERSRAHHHIGELHFLVGMPLVRQSPIEAADAECRAQHKDQCKPPDGPERWPGSDATYADFEACEA